MRCGNVKACLARNAAELMTLSATLQSTGIQLELLSGPLTGIYDPHGMGSMLFAVLAIAAQLDRDYIREKTLARDRCRPARPAAGRCAGHPPATSARAGRVSHVDHRGRSPRRRQLAARDRFRRCTNGTSSAS
jgi:DNA invertase Pin-like site-specific DNA recombinase